MNTKEVLNKNNFVFKKKFGQNFLLDNNILNNIVNLGIITEKTLVIEVGVGAAALTKKLCEKAGFVIGYEVDCTLKDPLKEILSCYNNVKVIFDDFLNRNINEDLNDYSYDEIIVVANLPYYITTPIITKFIEQKVNISKIIVMVQNEVADRFSAEVGTKNYNSLTIFLNYYFNIKKAFVVSRNVFFPKPNVDSAVVVFERKKQKIEVYDEELFFKLIKDSFTQKRKTLKNNLKGYDLEKIDIVLRELKKDISFRAENITIDEFAKISNYLAKH